MPESKSDSEGSAPESAESEAIEQSIVELERRLEDRRLEDRRLEDCEPGDRLVDAGLDLERRWRSLEGALPSSDPTSVWMGCGRLARAAGRRGEARRLIQAAHGLRLDRLGPDHVDRLRAAEVLASVHFDLYDLHAGIALLEEVLPRRRKQWDERDHRLLSLRLNLAGQLREASELGRASEQCHHVLAALEGQEKDRNKPGGESPEARPEGPGRETLLKARALSLLGRIHYSSSRYEEARSFEEEALGYVPWGVRRLADLHIGLEINLASTCWKLDAYEDARRLEESALSHSREALGEEHFTTLTAWSNLLFTLKDQGELDRVAAELPALESAASRTVPANHPMLLSIRELRRDVLQLQGQEEEALRLCREDYVDFAEILGAEHYKTRELRKTLARLEIEHGDPERAVELLEEALRRLHGDDHGPLSDQNLRAYHELELQRALGEAFAESGRHEEALPLLRAILHRQDEDPEATPADVLSTLWPLGSALRSQEPPDFAETEAVLRRTLELSGPFFGENHRETLITWANLGNSLLRAGKLQEGVDAYQRAYQGRCKAFGEDDPGTWSTLVGLALGLAECGETEAARPMAEQALEHARRAGLLADPAAQRAFLLLAQDHFDRGEIDAATACEKEALEALENGDRRSLIALSKRIEKSLAWHRAGQIDVARDLLIDREQELLVAAGLEPGLKVEALAFLASLAAGRGEFDRAVELQRQAIDTFAPEAEDDPVSAAALQRNLSFKLFEAGETEDAIEVGSAALEAFQRLDSDPGTKIQIAKSSFLLGVIFGRLQERTASLELLAEAHAIQSHLLGEEHTETAETQRWLTMVNDLPTAGALTKADGRKEGFSGWLSFLRRKKH